MENPSLSQANKPALAKFELLNYQSSIPDPGFRGS
jgi:hypothetical protein